MEELNQLSPVRPRPPPSAKNREVNGGVPRAEETLVVNNFPSSRPGGCNLRRN